MNLYKERIHMKQHICRKGILIAVTGLVAAFLLGSCSVIFSSYISGMVYDKELYTPDNPAAAAVPNAQVFLYADEATRNSDFQIWYDEGNEQGKLPNELSSPNYFMFSKTDDAGEFTFSGFTWKELNPEFGKTADRQSVYFLVYHDDYGLKKNTDPEHIQIVSDIDNTIPDLLLERFRNSAQVTVTLEPENSEDTGGIPVRIYVAEDWDYDGSDEIINAQWPDDPDYEGVTNGEGEYELDVVYPKKPNSVDSKGTGPVRIVIDAEDYQITSSPVSPASSTESEWGTTIDEDRDAYYSFELEEGEIHTFTWELKKTVFENQQLSGYVFDDTHSYTEVSYFNDSGERNLNEDYDEGINNLRVGLYMNDPGSPTSLDGADYLSLTENNGNADGYYSFNDISWTDENYTNRSTREVYVFTEQPDAGDGLKKFEITLFADENNTEDLEVDDDSP
jgi:hypothetical protein